MRPPSSPSVDPTTADPSGPRPRPDHPRPDGGRTRAPGRRRWKAALAAAGAVLVLLVGGALAANRSADPAGRVTAGSVPTSTPGSPVGPPTTTTTTTTGAPAEPVAEPTTTTEPATSAVPRQASESPSPGAETVEPTTTGASPETSVAQAQGSLSYASTAPAPPAADIPPDPDLAVACRDSTVTTTGVCLDAAELAIDNARAAEGVGPLTLPADFEGLTPSGQLLVLVDCERVDRGLTPVAGELGVLDQLAGTGAADGVDPVVPVAGVPGLTVGAWTSNWASSDSLLTDFYLWMYDDGPGSANVDCTAADQSGCWDHRDNILGFQNDVDGDGGTLAFGGAAVSSGAGRHSSAVSATTLIAWSPGTVTGFAFTWAEAVADGAG
jgi:hypothetical protein